MFTTNNPHIITHYNGSTTIQIPITIPITVIPKSKDTVQTLKNTTFKSFQKQYYKLIESLKVSCIQMERTFTDTEKQYLINNIESVVILCEEPDGSAMLLEDAISLNIKFKVS